MKYGSTRDQNRIYQHPEELLIVNGIVQQYFSEGIGAVDNLAFRRLMVRKDSCKAQRQPLGAGLQRVSSTQ